MWMYCEKKRSVVTKSRAWNQKRFFEILLISVFYNVTSLKAPLNRYQFLQIVIHSGLGFFIILNDTQFALTWA